MADHYHQGFEEIVEKYNLNISKGMIEKSVEILKSFNPRISNREIEYPIEMIFGKALDKWQIGISLQECVEAFWQGLRLIAEIYPETIDVLIKLKEKGYKIAVLTDLPSGMPDEIFLNDVSKLMEYVDYYVSSAVAGFRKPNPAGLKMIADRYSISVDELIFVGDEDKDEKTALNAGCSFIRVNRSGNMNGIIRNLCELLEILV